MKKNILLLLAAVVLLFACQSGSSPKQMPSRSIDSSQVLTDSAQGETVSQSAAQEPQAVVKADTARPSDYDYTAPYICPNHCQGSGSDKPGKCPVCGMDLIPNPDYQHQVKPSSGS